MTVIVVTNKSITIVVVIHFRIVLMIIATCIVVFLTVTVTRVSLQFIFLLFALVHDDYVYSVFHWLACMYKCISVGGDVKITEYSFGDKEEEMRKTARTQAATNERE